MMCYNIDRHVKYLFHNLLKHAYPFMIIFMFKILWQILDILLFMDSVQLYFFVLKFLKECSNEDIL